MGQLLVRQLDDADINRLRIRARARKTSVEAIAREAIRKEALLTTQEKLDMIREMQAWSERARVPGSPQSLGVDLLREARDE